MDLPAALQSRPFTALEAFEAGVPRRVLARLVDEGGLARPLRGVYCSSLIALDLETRCRAAALVMPPFGLICDRTAAWLHGVDLFALKEYDEAPPLDISVLRGHSRRRRTEYRSGSRDLTPRDVQRIHGVWVTTPLRTALDLGCLLRPRDALVALDGFMRVSGVTLQEMQAELPRYRRRRGVVQLRWLVPLAIPTSESPGESWTRMAIVEAGLPIPEAQHWVRDDDGVRRYRLDLAYPEARIAVEYDGREFHTSEARRKLDRERRDWLRRHGWTVLVVDKDSFGLDALFAWTNELRRALRSREVIA